MKLTLRLCLLCIVFVTIVSNVYSLPTTSSHNLVLRDNFQKAQAGDFIVTISSKNYTLLHIHAKTEDSIILEEVTVPESKVSLRQSWRQWMQNNAPHHTSWVMYDINLNNGQMQEFFSFSKNGWSDIGQTDNFLSTLLNLKFKLIPIEDRKRVGTASFPWEKRPYWHPPMVLNGQTIKGVSFDAWITQWPKDGSDLSGKTIEVYLPSDNPNYLVHFPYWLQISGMVGKAKIRIVDSGRNLISPKPSLPRRPPEFLSNGKYNGNNLSFTVRSKPYYKTFTLLAQETKGPKSKALVYAEPVELPFTVRPSNEKDVFFLEIAHHDIESKLQSEKPYIFVLQPVGFPRIYVETPAPLVLSSTNQGR